MNTNNVLVLVLRNRLSIYWNNFNSWNVMFKKIFKKSLKPQRS